MLARFLMGVAAGITAQGIIAFWRWLRAPTTEHLRSEQPEDARVRSASGGGGAGSAGR